MLDNSEKAPEIGRQHLECLPDRNYLKPMIWAEHKNKPECFGVSLGVRSFVRPLYLGIKLSQLRNDENVVKLEDVNAFQSMDRNMSSKYKKNNIKPPCHSCQIFFEKERNFSLFGNCAEYDAIGTASSNGKLREIKKRQDWVEFELACKKHLTEFSKLTSDLKTYYKKTRTTTILKYKWIPSNRNYELKSKKWTHG